ncbi:MAG: nitrate reductase associated protein [Prochlorococcus sp.]|nr:nitrate reductase associated protein [Prochlorococcaceae cyanobacterium Fu_MAG_50]
MSSISAQASHCFEFEQDFIGSWRCIPLCVRRKLDLIGLKLKLSHWLELSHEQRQQIVDWQDDARALANLRNLLCRDTRSMADGQASDLPPAKAEPWQIRDHLPESLAAAAASHGISFAQQQWRELSELERFALCKLARPGHDHHNLPAAFRELLG